MATRCVTRDELRVALLAWQAGELTAAQLRDWAENLYAVDDVDVEDEIANEVLANLDILDINLTTVDDVPVFLKMLSLPVDRVDEAAELLQEHGESIDIAERMRRYRDDPFYGRFCT